MALASDCMQRFGPPSASIPNPNVMTNSTQCLHDERLSVLPRLPLLLTFLSLHLHHGGMQHGAAQLTANMTSTTPKSRKRQRSALTSLGSLGSVCLVANFSPSLVAPTAVLAFSGKTSSSPNHILKICQNKDCRKRFSPRAPDGSLVDTIQDLLPSSSDDIAIEPSGCLSQCGKGPNMCVVEATTGKERLFFGVDSASTAAAILDVACDYDPPVDLILAADKISKAQIGKCQSGEWEFGFFQLIFMPGVHPVHFQLKSVLLERIQFIESPTRAIHIPCLDFGAICVQY